MESLRLVLTSRARADLNSLYEYIAYEKGMPKTAEEFTQDLAEKLIYLAKNGIVGTPRYHVKDGLHGYTYRGWCFYLTHSEEELVVMRVLHSKQDVGNQEF